MYETEISQRYNMVAIGNIKFIQCVVKPLALSMGISVTSIEFTQVMEDGLNRIYHEHCSTRSSEPIY